MYVRMRCYGRVAAGRQAGRFATPPMPAAAACLPRRCCRRLISRAVEEEPGRQTLPRHISGSAIAGQLARRLAALSGDSRSRECGQAILYEAIYTPSMRRLMTWIIKLAKPPLADGRCTSLYEDAVAGFSIYYIPA